MALELSGLTIISVYGVDLPVPNTVYSVIYRFTKELSGFTAVKNNIFYPGDFTGITPTVYSATSDSSIYDWLSGYTSLATVETELDTQITDYFSVIHPFRLR